MNEKLNTFYTNTKLPGSYGGVNSFTKSLKKQKINIKDPQVKKWLLEKEYYTLHRPKRKNFKRRQVIVPGIDHTWQADLVDVSSLSDKNDDFKFILTCIDVFSKYAWAMALKNKSGKTLETAFETFLSERRPLKLHTDKGSEFYNKNFKGLLDKYKIKMYSTESELKACIVERFNRTLKEKMWRMFTDKKSYRYIDDLDNLIYSYNNTYHNSIKCTPKEVKLKDEEKIFKRLYGYNRNYGDDTPIHLKFKINDKVRISKYKRVFEKGYTPNWTREIFIVYSVIATNPAVYKIKDLNDEKILGTFYDYELQKIYKYDEIFLIDEILKTRVRNNQKEYLVSWLGYPASFNSWVKDIIPQ